jgi:lactoylglutathione lyase
MKLNHLNLSVTDVPGSQGFLEKYFGMKGMGGGNASMAGLRDDNGLVLTLMRIGKATEVTYPPSFHIGFILDSHEQVDVLNRRLKDDGFDVNAPATHHGSWGFYFLAPGGFTIEVGHWPPPPASQD